MSNRAKRLTGINPLSYLGVEPYSPPGLIIESRIPNSQDSNGFNLGDIWINSVTIPETIWVLVNLDGGDATWVQIYPVSAGDLTFNTSNGSTTADNAGVINFIGDDIISTNAITEPNTVSFHISGVVATTYHTDDGNNAVPIGNILNILGGQTGSLPGVGININTKSSANTVEIDLNNTIQWPNTTADGLNGIIYLDGDTFLHNYGTSNTFLGAFSGNLTLTTADSTENVGIGDNALNSLTTSNSNTAVGTACLLSLSSGGGNNCAIGNNSGAFLTTGSSNDLIGTNSAVATNNTSGLMTGNANVIIGSGASVPFPSGSQYSGAESSNILIRNVGVTSENNTIRIGTFGSTGTNIGEQNRCFIAGINDSSITATGVVLISGDDQLTGTTGSNGQILIGGGGGPVWADITAGTNITVTNGPNSILISATGGGGTGILEVTGNSGGAVGPDGSNNINIVGTNVITIAGNASTHTETVSLTNGTNGQLLIGGGSVPLWANLTSVGATVTITNGANSINLEAVGGGGGTAAFVTDSGTANEVGGSITIAGGSNINTSGSGDVVTINLDNSPSVSGSLTAGTSITAGDGIIATTGDIEASAGNVDAQTGMTINAFGTGVLRTDNFGRFLSDNGTNGQLLIGGGSAPEWQNITAGTGISITNAPNSITINSTGSGTSFADPFLAIQFVTTTYNATGASFIFNYNMGSQNVLTEIFDVGNNFFPGDGAGGAAFFTAPATGFYQFYFQVTVLSFSSGSSGVLILTEPFLSITTTARTFQTNQYAPGAISSFLTGGSQGTSQSGNNFHTWNMSSLCDMTIGDTAIFNISVSLAGNNSISVIGTSSSTVLNTWIQGYRVA
jgi:hypothetical protein